MQTVSVLVAERDAEWLAWARALRRCAGNLIVLAQNATEDHAAFSERVSSRLARLKRLGTPIREAAYVTGDSGHPDAGAHRSNLMRRLSAVLTGSGTGGRLYLDPSARGEPEAKTLMQALAWTLSELAQGSGLSVEVRGAATVT